MSLTPEMVATAALVVAGAYLVFGLTGFGSWSGSVPLASARNNFV